MKKKDIMKYGISYDKLTVSELESLQMITEHLALKFTKKRDDYNNAMKLLQNGKFKTKYETQ